MAYTPPGGSPLATYAHPRLHFTSATLGTLRSKIQTDYSWEWQQFVSWLESNWATDAFSTSSGGLNADRFAFVWTIRNDGDISGTSYARSITEYRDRAIEIVNNLVAADSGDPGGASAGYYYWNDPSVMARAYDWMFSEMTNTERGNAAEWLSNARGYASSDAANEISKNNGLFSSAYFETPMPWYIALAFWGDYANYGTGTSAYDTSAQTGLDDFDTLMANGEWLDIQNYWAGDHGGLSEYGHYGMTHPMNHIVQIDGWRTATTEDYFTSVPANADEPRYNFILHLPEFYAHFIDNHTGELNLKLKLGQGDAAEAFNGQPGEMLRFLGEPVNSDSDMAGLAQWLKERCGEETETIERRMLTNFIFGRKDATSLTPTAAGIATTEQVGIPDWLVTHQDWADTGGSGSNNSIIAIGCGSKYGRGHSWFRVGDFPIGFHYWKEGPIIMRHACDTRTSDISRPACIWFTTSALQSSPDTGVSGDHFRTMGGFLPDPGGVSNLSVYTGGSTHDTGSLDRIEIYDDTGLYDYSFVTCTGWFDNSIVTNYTLQTVYLRPSAASNDDFIVCFERTETADSATMKRKLMAFPNEPTVNGSESGGSGYWNYTGADQIYITNDYGVDPFNSTDMGGLGAAYINLLAPSGFNVMKAGGSGHVFDNDGWFMGSEADMGGAGDYANLSSANMGGFHTGSWRCEVQQTGSTTDNFLTVIQGGLAATLSATGNQRINGTNGEGAHIEAVTGQSEWVVMFSKTEADMTSLDYNISSYAGGTVKHLICDLAASTSHEVYQGVTLIATASTSTEGTLQFDSTSGGSFTINQGTGPPTTGDVLQLVNGGLVNTGRIGAGLVS